MAPQPHNTASIQARLQAKYAEAIVLIGDYNHLAAVHTVQCQDCSHRWQVNIREFTRPDTGGRCPQCTVHPNALSQTQVEQRLAAQGRGLSLVGSYQPQGRSNTYHCARCETTWSAKGMDLITGRNGCPTCATHRSRGYTPQEYRAKLRLVHPTLRPTTPYVNAVTKLTFRCDRGHEFENDPRAVLALKGCPWCPRPGHLSTHLKSIWAQGGNSLGALRCIAAVAKRSRLEFRTCQHKWGEYKLEGTRYSLDGYNKQYRIAIEYHGSYYHGERNKQSDRYKRTIRRDRAVRKHSDVGLLIVIWESEWKSSEKATLKRVLAEITAYKADTT